ncbi:MAG TPA: ABC transporter permease [Edaphocola sp.]|nr:ABC transporter permease [Edaphocola sp.]
MKTKKQQSIQLLLIGLLLFNALWFVTALLFQNKALPNPIEVYSIFPKTFKAGMAEHIWASSQRVVIGILISLILGIIGGVLTAMSKRINQVLEPLLYLSYPIPKLALMPIIMIVFGIGETTKIVMIVLIIVFQLIISIRDAIRRIPKENYYVLSSIGASRFQQIKHIMIPGVLPDILSAIRVTVGIAISVLFVTESFGTDKGLGFFIVDSWMRLDYISMYAGIVALSVIGFLLFLIIDLVDTFFCKWNKI